MNACAAASPLCKEVSFPDLPGAVFCFPTTFTSTTGQVFAPLSEAFSACAEATPAPAECRDVRIDYYTFMGCATCGDVEQDLAEGVDACGGVDATAASCGSGAAGAATSPAAASAGGLSLPGVPPLSTVPPISVDGLPPVSVDFGTDGPTTGGLDLPPFGGVLRFDCGVTVTPATLTTTSACATSAAVATLPAPTHVDGAARSMAITHCTVSSNVYGHEESLGRCLRVTAANDHA